MHRAARVHGAVHGARERLDVHLGHGAYSAGSFLRPPFVDLAQRLVMGQSTDEQNNLPLTGKSEMRARNSNKPHTLKSEPRA